MCSIVGGADKKWVLGALEKMKHRAPDGTNVIDDGKFAMGAGRLAIIDLTSKNLFPYREGNLTLSFNGEIYNYVELRKELKAKGHVFTTQSDTEVLLKAYKEWGKKCLNKLNGMFAFAIYDGQMIFLARDIAGEKPLYYKEYPFRFASEAKALDFDCRELPPATYMIYQNGKAYVRRYWRLELRDINPNTAEEELEWLLEDSIKLRTRSDVPYGLYYSGGIDSSLIATFHDFEHKFSYRDQDYQEEFLRVFPKILWHLDSPVKSFSPFGLWKLAEMASREVKVVISGEGADELFGGYVRYVQPEFNYQAQKAFPSYQTMFQSAKSVHDAGWEEFNGNMRELLRMGDRMASAFGIENRCPFLDKRIIEFAYSLPSNLKINGLETKVLLRRILERRNPNYKHIEKQGLYCSVNKWLGLNDKLNKDGYLKYQQSIWQKFL